MRFVLLALHAALLFIISSAQCESMPHVTVSGRLFCRGSDISFVTVVLTHRIGFMNNAIGETVANEDGSFHVKGVPHYMPNSAKPTLSLRLRYFRSAIKAEFWMFDGDDIPVEYEGANINIGDQHLDSDVCGAYVSFNSASVDYYNRVGNKTLPVTIVRDETAPNDTPFVEYSKVFFKPGYVWSKEVAQHEIAHVMRHYYDGNSDHFFADVGMYGLEEKNRTEGCGRKSNEGFAFNEGWALYWQGICMESNADGPHTVEGNVAAALRRLESICDSSAAQMWAVLMKYPGAIHSFSEYESHHKKLHNCP